MTRPLPITNAYTRPFWKSAAEGRLSVPRCAQCGRLHWTPAPRCPQCSSDALKWQTVSGRGRLIGWTTVHLDVLPGVPPPFTLCAVELNEQQGLILSALVDSSQGATLKLGSEAQIEFEPPATCDIALPLITIL